MRDRAMQALYLLVLSPIAEVTGDPNSYGFRPKRSTADAIEQCFTALGRRETAEWTYEADIQACFDEISHDWLLEHIPMEKPILKQWLKAGVIEKQVLHQTAAGTPQGGIASPVLANLTLDGLEQMLKRAFGRMKQAEGKSKVNLVRYADDFIITGRSQALLQEEVAPKVACFLRERGLTLSPHKTRLTHIKEGFDFLGQNIRKYNGKLLIKPAQKSIKSVLQKVRSIVKDNAQSTAGNLILQLNPVMRGWANYHRHVISKVTFNRVAHRIFQIIWRWSARRHPRKPKRWVKEKYFQSIGHRNWVFRGEVRGKDGQPHPVCLFDLNNVSIKRHIKIRNNANPYDPAWRAYFEQRQILAQTE